MAMIISVSGIRGLVGTELDAAFALKTGMILGEMNPDRSRPLVVAGDSRISGAAIRSAVIAGILASGRNVVDLGVAATPTACFMVRRLNAAGGAIVTASHNPIQWNGIKLIGGDGFGISVDQAAQFKERVHGPMPMHAGATECGQLTRDDDAHGQHIDAVLANRDPKCVKKLRDWAPTVVLDSVNGAGSIAGLRLLEALGCNIVAINAEPSGRFAHTPEPIPENLTQLGDAVRKNKAVVGFAQDPDADRLALVDETGTPMGEEYTLALAAYYVMGKRCGGVAANLSTSRMVDDIAEKFGQPVYRTPVGEANVAAAIFENHCVMGGEGNGGVILPDVVPVRDSLTGMAIILDLMASTGKSLTQLKAEMPSYVMLKTKAECSREKADALCTELTKIYADQKISTADGLRIDFPAEKAWVHIRGSNTEPIIRIISEALTQARAEALVAEMTKHLK